MYQIHPTVHPFHLFQKVLFDRLILLVQLDLLVLFLQWSLFRLFGHLILLVQLDLLNLLVLFLQWSLFRLEVHHDHLFRVDQVPQVLEGLVGLDYILVPKNGTFLNVFLGNKKVLHLRCLLLFPLIGQPIRIVPQFLISKAIN